MILGKTQRSLRLCGEFLNLVAAAGRAVQFVSIRFCRETGFRRKARRAERE
jgi:hypothetical protein